MKNYMIIKNRLVLALALMLSAVSVLPVVTNAQTTTASVACHNFATDLYYQMTAPQARINRYRDVIVNPAYVQYLAELKSFHQILQAEGYPVTASDEFGKKFGKATAIALIKYQTANKAAIGEDPSGILTEKTRNVFNQKYGCIAKATINLTEPDKDTVRARGEVIAIKWDATKIPNTTDLTIQYVSAQNSNASTTITTVSGVRNGKGQYNWTVPSTMALGQYKILVSLTGATKSDVSAKAFEIRDKSLEVTSPSSGEITLIPGNKLPITWKTSAAIKPADKIKVSIVGTLVSDGAASTTVELARVSNTGSYTWTVPERFNNRIITGTSTFDLVLQTENNSQTSTSSTLIKIKPSTNAVVSAITVSQPTLSTQFLVGQKIPIKWTSTGLKSTDEVEIGLVVRSGPNTGDYRLATNIKNTGAYTWEIPSSIVRTGVSFNLATTTLNQYQIAISPYANTAVRGTSQTFSIVPTPTVIQPKITVADTSIVRIARGTSMPVNWTTNGAFPTTAKVQARLVRVVGNTETKVADSAQVAASANSVSLAIPALAIPSTTNTSTDYKIVLVVTGLTSTNPLDSASDLSTNGFAVSIQGLTAGLTAQTNIPPADNNIIYKPTALVVNIAGTNIANNTSITAKLVTASGQNPNVAVSTTGKINNDAGAVTLTLPTTLAVGTYKVVVSTVIDTRSVQAETSNFEVRVQPVVQPKIVIGAVPNDVERGVPFNITWTSNAVVPTTGRVHIELVNAATNARMSYLATSVVANANSKEVVIPAGTPTNGSYKVRIVPISGVTNLDSTSVLESNAFNAVFRAGQITATAFSTVVSRDSSIVVGLAGNAPANTRLSFNLMKSDGASVSGVPTASALMSATQVNFPIPATVPVGTYKIGVSGTVDTNLISTTTASFEVKNPYLTFVEGANKGGLVTTVGANGSTTSMNAVFSIDVTANGSAFTKPLPANFTIALENTATGATISPTLVLVNGVNLAKNSSGTYTVSATFNTSGLASSYAGLYRAKLLKMTYTFNGVPTTKTDWTAAYDTPAVQLVR